MSVVVLDYDATAKAMQKASEMTKHKDYASVKERVDKLNEGAKTMYNLTSGGGFTGYSTSYGVVAYKRNGDDCIGYKKTTGSYVLGIITTYYDASGIDITEKIYEEDGTLHYKTDFIDKETDVVTNLWPLAVVILAVAAVLITLIVNRKK